MFDQVFNKIFGNRFDDLEFTLFNKNVPVADLRIGQFMGDIKKVTTLYNKEALPVPALFSPDVCDGLNFWFRNRSISTSRIRNGEIFGTKLSLQNLGLNLSDQYWFRPKGYNFTWNDVNLFKNSFDIKYFTGAVDPSFSSNGEQEKYWEIRGKERVLVKVSRKTFYQEAANEVFSSRLLQELDVPHISYSREGRNSVCATAIDENTEYVPFVYILNAAKKLNNKEDYLHFFRCVESVGLPVERSDIDNMLVFDFLINNVDRNFGNFGYIRKAETGKFVSLFPYFDHGNSMWYNESNRDISADSFDSVGKPFGPDMLSQLSYVGSLSFSFDRLSKDFLKETVTSVYSSILDEERVSRLSDAVCQRLDMVQDRFKNFVDKKSFFMNGSFVEVDHSWAKDRLNRLRSASEHRLSGGDDGSSGVDGGRS